jgi:hypothetical protein
VTYLVERVYHTPHVCRIPCGRYADKTEARHCRDRVRDFHPDVAGGLCNVSVRRVGS